MKTLLHKYRFEFLFFALVMVIFNKIFIRDDVFYREVVWPINMILLGLVSLGIFHERQRWEQVLRSILFIGILAIPLAPRIIFQSETLSYIGMVVYILFYSLLFYSVMYQITRNKVVSESVIFGSLSGFLLMIVVATFSFLLLDLASPGSFNNIVGSSIPEWYQQFTYFSLISLTTIGYGDITPGSEQARLLAGFWGVMSQFYMVAIVGIIIAKYTSK
ncbi:MAG: hypothetical protein KDC24_02905 [Saprospiraceae bacterium]|nr:hypothetical protein [Saprospiraceae bacterium]